MKKTILEELEFDPENIWYINTPDGRADNNGYAAPFPIWWKTHDLNGWGYLIGEQHPQGQWINKKLQKWYEVKYAHSVDLNNADIVLDISKDMLPEPLDFIFCMAVLEHLYDPLAAIRNMSKGLTAGGLLSISVPANGFKQHRRPIDCYRFMEDAMYAFAKVGNIMLLDYTSCQKEWCAIYRKLK